MREHPFERDVRANSDYGREIQDEMRAEARRKPPTCTECGGSGGHSAGCPADEDDETPIRSCGDGCNGCEDCTDYDETDTGEDQ